MIYGDICSGISVPTLAAKPLGWKPAFYSEIEKFPRALLKHYYPDVPLHGDFTSIQRSDYGSVDILIGGTPCQSFSIAGKRLGMADPRGNLSLEYLALAGRLNARWLVFENVPGLLSNAEEGLPAGTDFAVFLSAATGYEYDPPAAGWGSAGIAKGRNFGIAWRVLDSQYFGVAQRRDRLFVVGYSGDWRRAGSVLLEPEGFTGNPPPDRKRGQASTRPFTTGTHGGGWTDIAPTLDVKCKDGPIRKQIGLGILEAARMTAFGEYVSDGLASTVKARDYKDATDLVVSYRIAGNDFFPRGEVSGALCTGTDKNQNLICGPGLRVRRTTPRECERLQGLPDDFTLIPFNGKPATDTPRYKAIGNAMTRQVMDWILGRIDKVEKISCR